MNRVLLPSPAGLAVVDDGVAACNAAAEGLTDYSRAAFARGATPLTVTRDVLRWWTTVTKRKRPTWTLPNEIVFDDGIARLRDFSRGSRAQVLPTLVLPP